MYSSLINNDPIEGEKCVGQLQEDVKRLNKFLKADELSNETIFSEKSVKVTMSGLRSNLGKIIDCSKNIADFYGWKGNDMKGKSIGSLMPPFFRQRHDGILLNHFNTGKTRIINKTLIVPVKRSNGYIHASWIHAKVSPFMYNGLSYVALLKPCKLSQRMVLVKTDGKIDDMCLGFAKDMNLTGAGQIESEIFKFCPEFKKINEAFNIIAEGVIEVNSQQEQRIESYSPSKNSSKEGDKLFIRDVEPELSIEKFNIQKGSALPRMEKEKAQFIYDHFNAGSTLVFHPRDKTVGSITYNVKVLNSIHGKDVIKFVLLERVSNNEDEAQFSDKEDAFSSVKMIAKQFHAETFPSSPKLLQTQSSPVTFETERAELLHLVASPRLRSELKFLETNEKNNETNLSISDEMQDEDSTAKKAITRNILRDSLSSSNFGSSPRKKRRDMKVVEDHMFQTIQTQSAFVMAEGNPLQAIIKKKASTYHTLGKQNKRALNQKQRVKPERVEDAVVDVVQIETSVGSSFGSKGKKVKQMVVRALRGEPKKKSASIFTYLSVIFLVLMIILLVVQNRNLHAGINDFQAQLPVMVKGFFRVYEMISATSTIEIWMEVLKGTFGFDWVKDNLEYRSYLTWYADQMHAYNTEFFQLLSDLPEEIKRKFYDKNVGIYEYGDGDRTLIGTYSTFEAFQLMSEKQYSCLNQEIPDHFVAGIDTTNWKFVTDNALNDLLVEADHQNAQLVDELDDSASLTKMRIILTLAIVLVICLIFILVAIRYLWRIASEVRIFMTILFRIKVRESEAIQLTLQQFLSALDRNVVLIQDKIQFIEDPSNQNINRSIKFRKASMSSFYRTQRVIFMKFLPIFILFICWSIIYYFLTSNFIANITDSQERMEAAMQALNDQGLFVHETVAIALTNGTALIKNEPVMPAYLKSLENLQQVDRFVDRFRDRKGKLTALQERVLFNYSCESFLPILKQSPESYNAFIYAYDACLHIQSKRGSVSLVSLYSTFANNGLYFLEQYEASNKTEEDLKNLFLLAYALNVDEINTAEGFLMLLHQATEESFYEEVDSIKTKIAYFAFVTIVVTLVAVWMTWLFVIKRVFRIQKIDWLILQVIPVQVILGNKHIQQYLLRRSDGMLDGVKSYL